MKYLSHINKLSILAILAVLLFSSIVTQNRPVKSEEASYLFDKEKSGPYRFDIGEGDTIRLDSSCGWSAYRPNPSLWDDLSWPVEQMMSAGTNYRP